VNCAFSPSHTTVIDRIVLGKSYECSLGFAFTDPSGLPDKFALPVDELNRSAQDTN
jgi:hypothetical protein